MLSSNQTEPISTDNPNQICPDITLNWIIHDQIESTGQLILQAKIGNRRHQFDAIEGYAIKYFNGQETAFKILNRCRSRFGTSIPSNLVAKLLEKLLTLEIIDTLPAITKPNPNRNQTLPINPPLPTETTSAKPETPTPNPTPQKSGISLKDTVEWIQTEDGYWILRNAEEQTFFQFDDFDKRLISQLGHKPLIELANLADISLEQLQELLKSLAQAGMLEGTKAQKPPNKFNLLKILSFQIPLCNPDKFLTKQIDKLSWIWTWQCGFFLTALIAASISVWLAFADGIMTSHQQVWKTGGNHTLLTFGLLIMLVVFLHELGHAFTLKHYGGTVPEIGLLFIFFMPGGYTNTTDQYSLVRRKQRALVVGAGLIVQLVIWAFAVWLWIFSKSHPALHNASYLLMTAALLTVAFNLNPLNKFDGYYLLVALTGINHLRERSFQFYADLLKREESWENPGQQWILAAYAPLTIAYTIWIFTSLFSWVYAMILQHFPAGIDLTQLHLFGN
jgi:putative peptide zinc metalloprotease protein